MDTRMDFVMEKAFTFLMDRRLWGIILAFVFIVRGGAEDLNATEALTDQAINWVSIIFTAILAVSWSIRPPTPHKKSVENVEEVLEKLIGG